MRYIARFYPVTRRDNRFLDMPTTAPTEWDATESLAQRAYDTWIGTPFDRIRAFRQLKADPHAPEWIRQWIGMWRIDLRLNEPLPPLPGPASPILLSLAGSRGGHERKRPVESISPEPTDGVRESPAPDSSSHPSSCLDLNSAPSAVHRRLCAPARSRHAMVHVGVLMKVSYDGGSTELTVEQHTWALIKSLQRATGTGLLTEHDSAAVVDVFDLEPYWRDGVAFARPFDTTELTRESGRPRKSPRDWLEHKISATQELPALASIALSLSGRLDEEALQALFEQDMKDDGYASHGSQSSPGADTPG
jgi:hypothetical protein